MPRKKKGKKKAQSQWPSRQPGHKRMVTSKFKANVEGVKEYVKNHGKLPERKGIGEEKRLSRFLTDQKQAFLQGKLTVEAIGLLDGIDGFSIRSTKRNKDRELEWLEKVEEFVEEHQRLPTRSHDTLSRKNDDKTESSLAQFLERCCLKIRQSSESRGVLSKDVEKRLNAIPGFSSLTRIQSNMEQYGTADQVEIRTIKRRIARDATAKIKADLIAQQCETAKTGVEQFLMQGLTNAKKYTNFDCMKESNRQCFLCHASLVPTKGFERYVDSNSKEKEGELKLKPYATLSKASQARVNHNHPSGPPEYVYAHGGGTDASFWSARHWPGAHMKLIEKHGKIITLGDGREVCEILTQLHYFFQYQRDFQKFRQVRIGGVSGIPDKCSLLARCPDAVTPGATAQLTFHVPIELMKECHGNKKYWCPTMFDYQNAVMVKWIHLDEDLERVLNYPLNDSRVVAIPHLGIMTRDFYQCRFAQSSASPLSGMVRSSGNDNDNNEESEIEELDHFGEQDDSSVAVVGTTSSTSLTLDTRRSNRMIYHTDEEEEEMEEAMRRSREDSTHRETDIPGIVNKGNTCYVNSVLQGLLSNQGFISMLGPYYSKSTQKNKLLLTEKLLEIAVAIGSLEAGLVPSIRPENALSQEPGSIAADASAFMSVIDLRLQGRFPKGTQQDSNELQIAVLDQLREEGKAAKEAAEEAARNKIICIETDNETDNSDEAVMDVDASAAIHPVDACFGIKIQQKLTCMKCMQSRSKDELYDMLSIEMNENEGEINKLVQKYFEAEFLTGDEMAECETCGCNTPTRKAHTIVSL